METDQHRSKRSKRNKHIFSPSDPSEPSYYLARCDISNTYQIIGRTSIQKVIGDEATLCNGKQMKVLTSGLIFYIS